ncbi:4Fe-4S dicluster domain-containing protein [bacterium]|nr:4Fe-4S dicluster domain-containing protein [bacterium]MBU1754622.1 4Fe-4S dicluster domain-containing protein [bacterium]
MNKTLQETARNLLAANKVDIIIGYAEGYDAFHARPVFISNSEDVDTLIFNKYCTNNLAVYLPIHKKLKVGIVAKACDRKSIHELIKEHQIPEESVVIIDAACVGVVGKRGVEQIDERCAGCDKAVGAGSKPALSEPALFSGVGVDLCVYPIARENDTDTAIPMTMDRFEKLTSKERERFWDKEFERCIRCYACRHVCPVCYCPDCFVNRSLPKYLNERVNGAENKLFSTVRMMHVFGRCTDCRACDNACPTGIPLHLLTKKMASDALELFGYESGQGQEHPFAVFKKDEILEGI